MIHFFNIFTKSFNFPKTIQSWIYLFICLLALANYAYAVEADSEIESFENNIIIDKNGRKHNDPNKNP